MLAIAAPSFNEPSETFIREHVRALAPGRTVLICLRGSQAGTLDCPILSGICRWEPPVGLWARIMNGFRHRWRRYVDPSLSMPDRLAVVKFLRKHHVNVMLAEYMYFGVLFIKACGDTGIPLVVHAHGYDVNILGEDRAWRESYRHLFRSGAIIIAASHFLRERILDLGAKPDQVVVSPLGVSYEDDLKNNGHRKLILCVSRLVPQKGVEFSIRSFRKALYRHPDAKLEIIGSGPCEEILKELVRELELEEFVSFLGPRDHRFVLERLSKASLFIQHCVSLPGKGRESFGLSVLEAMGAGLPVIVTNHGALSETLGTRKAGYIVDEFDVDGMSSAICNILSNPTKAKMMGQFGRQRVSSCFTQLQARDRLREILGLTP